MSMNPNWPKWCIASVNKHFADNISGLTEILRVGNPETDATDSYEVRIDGPDAFARQGGDWELRIEVNILVKTALDGEYLLRHAVNVGKVAAAFDHITVRKYGEEVADDESYVGCLVRRDSRVHRDLLEIQNFGQIETDVALEQSMVEGHFLMEVTT